MSKTVELEFCRCGGISTVESGFSFASTEVEGQKVYFLCNSEGQIFARFFEKGRRVQPAKNLSRGESEAIEGFKVLILHWTEEQPNG